MRVVPLGRTGIDVSEFFFGAGAIGGIGSSPLTIGQGLSAVEGINRLDEAYRRGIRAVDTANSYAGGESERVVGEWLRHSDRHDALIDTKVGNLVEPGQTTIDLSARHIARQFEQSVRRLGRVDLYLSHAPDPTTPAAETVEAFGALIADGRVRAWGCSNVTAAELDDLLTGADAVGAPRPGWVQNGFNLTMLTEERDVLELVRAEGLGYTPYSPLAGGVLSDRYLGGAPPVAGSRLAVAAPMYADAFTAENLTRVARLSELAAARSASTAGLALAWLRAHPDVTAPIVSPRTEDQWTAIDEALALDLTPDDMGEIAECFGG